MSERVQRALENHDKKYNCAQSVACAYCDLFGVDEKTTFRLAEAFGFGMGAMESCGAVTAMTMLVGMKLSDGNLEDPATKKVCYDMSKKMINAFKEKNQTIVCRELKGVQTGEPIRSCNGCIEDAARIVEEYLLEK